MVNKKRKGIVLRYFNPVGANFLKGLSESPLGKPLNIMPSIMNAVYKKKPLTIYCDNYQTSDGTCIRDYIHVEDLAKIHLLTANLILFGYVDPQFLLILRPFGFVPIAITFAPNDFNNSGPAL